MTLSQIATETFKMKNEGKTEQQIEKWLTQIKCPFSFDYLSYRFDIRYDTTDSPIQKSERMLGA
jgi:hypothetical protein